MIADALPWSLQSDRDAARRRLLQAFPLALVINAIVIYWFTYALLHTAVQLPVVTPLKVELVERPPQPKIKPVVPPKLPPPVQKTQPVSRPEVAAPAPAPVITATTPVPVAPIARATPEPVAAPAVSAQSNHSTPAESRGSQAIVHPYPEIPDELREVAMHETATARFHIVADGSFTVELIRPTQNLRLNRLLLDTLKRWKFFPAMKEGKPVASEQDVIINTQVQ